MQRRLAAILAGDVAGYTRLMAGDEAGTLRRLKALREEVLQPLIESHRGRVVKLMGDGLLVEFASVVDAVACAVAWQRDAEQHEATGHADDRLRFRIGINLGDVIVEGDDIYGDGVNIAARLQSLAPVGGICLSEDAYRQARGKVDTGFSFIGERELKNVAEPVRLYRVDFNAHAGGQSVRPDPALPDKASVAVLPFANLSGDASQEYFSDGITEDIITGLSRISSLFVISRNSSFVFKDKAVDVRQVARELGVRYVLEGSIQKAANRIRVTAQLIDSRSSAHLWVERYDRDLVDIFAVQDEIVGSIVHALGASDGILEKSERQRSGTMPAQNRTAYDFYLQGREQFDRQDDANFERAEDLFRKAIELDGNFARAYSSLAWLYFLRFKLTRTASFEDIRDEASRLAQQALQLDPNDYRAHWVLGFLLSHEGKRSQSLVRFDRALGINPNDANVLIWSAEVLIYWGRAREALERCLRAVRLNPKSPDFYYWMLGFTYFHLGRYEDAVAALEQMTAPRYARRLLAATYGQLGRVDEARAESEEYLKVDPEFSISAWAAAENYADPSELQRYVEGLRIAGLPD